MADSATKPFYVTTPIYYVNASPHIGHVYSTLIADVFARWSRNKKQETFLLTGTDEHGQKIAEAAKNNNMTPQEFTDKISKEFYNTFERIGFTFDHFVRTTHDYHKEKVKKLWEILASRGYITLGHHKGWYNVSDETFVTDANITTDGENKYCTETKRILIWHEEENYIFRLSLFQSALLKHMDENPNWIVPEYRHKEVYEFVKGGLRDLSISRKKDTCSWGIPIDENHVVYVWLDALTNYLSGPSLKYNDHTVSSSAWPADIHVIGKDILKFHAVYWPAFLIGANLPLPKKIIAHGWWTKDGEKIAKSTGNVFDVNETIKKYGKDPVLYYLLFSANFSSDGNFSNELLVSTTNSKLGNNLGNLVSRVTAPALLLDFLVPRLVCIKMPTRLL